MSSTTTKAPPTLTRHVRDAFKGKENDPQLFETAAAVRRVTSSPGFEAIKAVLDAEILSIDRKLDGEPLENASEYAHATGRRGALTAFADAAQAILEVADDRLSRATAEASQHDDAGESASER